MRELKIIIEGTPKEIADFVLEVQNRHEEETPVCEPAKIQAACYSQKTQSENIIPDVVSGREV